MGSFYCSSNSNDCFIVNLYTSLLDSVGNSSTAGFYHLGMKCLRLVDGERS